MPLLCVKIRILWKQLPGLRRPLLNSMMVNTSFFLFIDDHYVILILQALDIYRLMEILILTIFIK